MVPTLTRTACEAGVTGPTPGADRESSGQGLGMGRSHKLPGAAPPLSRGPPEEALPRAHEGRGHPRTPALTVPGVTQVQ